VHGGHPTQIITSSRVVPNEPSQCSPINDGKDPSTGFTHLQLLNVQSRPQLAEVADGSDGNKEYDALALNLRPLLCVEER
jgi:hypothetical protein